MVHPDAARLPCRHPALIVGADEMDQPALDRQATHVRVTAWRGGVAVERDDQLKARVEIGPAANIERIDNQQNIALRNAVLVQAQEFSLHI